MNDKRSGGARSWCPVSALSAVLLIGCGNAKTSEAPGSADGGTSSGCAADKTAQPFTVGMHQSSASGVTVAIESSPPVPTLNEDVTWKLTVRDKSGAPVPSGTAVAMLCKMSHAGFSHGCAPSPPVKETGEGQYEATPIGFNMGGHWVVTFQVGAEEIPFQLCVE